jgi:2-oxoisovalerate dehydrogenase E2 component (dihydrolipoyl transacylase)
MTVNTLQAQLFRLPDLGEGLTEAEVLVWRVEVGDTVEIDQIVVEVETAKAAVEVPVPFAGTALELHAPAGTTLDVGAPLISVGAVGTVYSALTSVHFDEAVLRAAAEQYREEEQAGSGNVPIGYGTGHAATPRRRRTRALNQPTPDAAPTQTIAPAAASGSTPTSGQAPRALSPVVRRLARAHGVDLAGIAAVGPAGVVRRRDVEAAITQSTTAAPSLEAKAAPVATSEERIPLLGVRRAVADKLSRSRTETPDATTWVDVDATELPAAKYVLKSAFPDRPTGLQALPARICVTALSRFPELNSSVDMARGDIVRYTHVNLGFAAQTERGLVVPVVRGAHAMTTAQIGAELARLTALARSGGLQPDVLTGGTFTLNNYGVFGVDGSTPIINHPEAAILGVGRIIDKPWVVGGALAVRKVTQLSLSFDHRVCDGGVAGGFLRYAADCVEHPSVLLADL